MSQPVVVMPGIRHYAPILLDDAPATAISATVGTAAQITDQARSRDGRPGPAATAGIVPEDVQGLSGGGLCFGVPPVYPSIAKSAGIEGTVVLQAVIGEQGSIQKITVTEGPPILALAAIEAVSHWRYWPFLLNGRAVKMAVDIAVNFTLQ